MGIIVSTDLENKPLEERLANGASFELWPYQLDAVKGIFRSWGEHQRVLLVLPTAGGKTIVFAKVARRRLEFGRVLALAHTDELVSQARDKFIRRPTKSKSNP